MHISHKLENIAPRIHLQYSW